MRFAATRRRWSRDSSKMQVLRKAVQFVQGGVPEHLRFDFLHARQAVETRLWKVFEEEVEEDPDLA